MAQCIIIRSHYANTQVLELVEVLRRVRPAELVLFTGGDSPLAGVDIPQILLGQELTDKLGILSPPDVGWRCGDYAFYGAYDREPSYDFYWLVEGDVYFSFEDVNTFFDHFERRTEDMLARRVGERTADWSWWYSTMKPYFDRVYGCNYPVVRLSNRAVRFLAQQRRLRTIEHMAASRAATEWPNDEAFTATELIGAGFACADLNACGTDVYTPATSSFGRLHPYAALKDGPNTELFYSSAFSGDRLFEKAKQFLSRMDDPQFDRILPYVLSECGVEPAQELLLRRANRRKGEGNKRLGEGDWAAAILLIDEAARLMSTRSALGPETEQIRAETRQMLATADRWRRRSKRDSSVRQ